MIRLSKLKKLGENCGPPCKRRFAYMRMTKEMTDLHLPRSCELDFPDPDKMSEFKLAITPDEGFYKNYRILFDFQVSPDYPYLSPKVKCVTPIYHPNIDGEGNVCLNILREDWKPVLTVSSVIYGLQFLLLEPNPDDALNEAAAKQLQKDVPGFVLKVKNVARGKASVKSIVQGSLPRY